jgi:CBS domain-containing protein
MIKYELLKTVKLSADNTFLRSQKLPELVHLDDPAFAVMCDFSLIRPRTIHADESMDDALNEMKLHGAHLLLVQGHEGNIVGVIASEDILGELPIKIINERRIQRSQILVKALMTPIEKIAAFDIKTLDLAKVGHIITTLKNLRTHYALVIGNNTEDGSVILRGIFTTSQISRQLHMDISDAIAKSHSVSELQKHKK